MSCKHFLQRDIMVSINTNNATLEHMAHQQRSLYLQPKRKERGHPWMSISTDDGGNENGELAIERGDGPGGSGGGQGGAVATGKRRASAAPMIDAGESLSSYTLK
ncbi:hypothetical protein FBU30_010601 [Linnemannia zychae]|nr:hypothetical protein FBU30_010601 [Linnemannia zychae]